MTPIGHLAIGFMVKPMAPRVNLGVLLLASWVLDLVYIGLAAAAGEPFGRPYSVYKPWTHGLAGALAISLIVAALSALFYRERRAVLIVGLAVFSHWLLDFLMWKDLPLLTADSTAIGLGLFSPERPGRPLVAEGVLFAAGVTLYVRYRRLARRLSP